MSSPRQTILQIRKIIQDATWPGGPTDAIVGKTAYITSGVEEDSQLPARLPFVLLNVSDGVADSDDPGLIQQEFVMVLVTAVGGHDLNEHSLVGGPGRAPGVGSGRGLLEIEEALLPEVQSLTGADGTPILVSHGTSPGPQRLGDRPVVMKNYMLSCWCSRADEFPAPSRLVATGGSGQIALTWDLPPSRYDLDSVILRYASGATAPASVTAGTGVSLVGAKPTSHTITGLAADDYSLAVFAKYVDQNEDCAEYSEQVTGTTRTEITVS